MTIETAFKSKFINDDQLDLFREEGYIILERVVPDDMLQMLREECSYFLGYHDSKLDQDNVKSNGITHRGSRYFISNQYRLSQRTWSFIFGEIMADITRATLGDDVFLFHEQWVVKGPDGGKKFAWHQDSGYVKSGDATTDHKPYLTCWVPLDDVNEDNGTVYLLPHSRGGTKNTIITHGKIEGDNDLLGYTGDDPGDPMVVPAGSVVAFTSYNFHRSSCNNSPDMRRVYLPQYSSEPIVNSQTGERWGMAVPFIKDGVVIYDHDGDTGEKYGGTEAISSA
ncbi:phytanoyl-CoA dioxygenase family protein [bacterium AH-315-E10]|nr:phytanoyl-CoA dioxygenase family protein [bacterium AH-315-E10]